MAEILEPIAVAFREDMVRDVVKKLTDSLREFEGKATVEEVLFSLSVIANGVIDVIRAPADAKMMLKMKFIVMFISVASNAPHAPPGGEGTDVM